MVVHIWWKIGPMLQSCIPVHTTFTLTLQSRNISSRAVRTMVPEMVSLQNQEEP
jgi:hypothetical protein